MILGNPLFELAVERDTGRCADHRPGDQELLTPGANLRALTDRVLRTEYKAERYLGT